MKNLMIFSGVAILGLLAADYLGSKDYCSFSCLQNYDGLTLNWLIIFSITFLVLFGMSFVHINIFKKWWKFARFAIPIILVISTIINLKLHHTNSGFFNMDNMLDIPAHILMYAIFIIGSVVQIWRGYRQK
jgi:hypothetical protein